MDGAPAPTFRGGSCRFRNDDGSETSDETDGGATWQALVDTNIFRLWNDPNNFRLRFTVSRDDNDDALDAAFFFKYSINGGGFGNITSGSNQIRSRFTSHYTHQDDSTDYALAGNGEEMYTGDWADSTNGCAIGRNSGSIETGTVTFAQDPTPQGIAVEICLQLQQASSPAVLVGDTYDIKMFTLNDGEFSQGYDFIPRITLTGGPPQEEYQRRVMNRMLVR